jgi:hypothetical protein
MRHPAAVPGRRGTSNSGLGEIEYTHALWGLQGPGRINYDFFDPDMPRTSWCTPITHTWIIGGD